MSDLTSSEWMDFHQNVVQKAESAFKKAFNATMFNWTCLMNNAFQAEKPKPHVHWHFGQDIEKMSILQDNSSKI